VCAGYSWAARSDGTGLAWSRESFMATTAELEGMLGNVSAQNLSHSTKPASHTTKVLNKRISLQVLSSFNLWVHLSQFPVLPRRVELAKNCFYTTILCSYILITRKHFLKSTTSKATLKTIITSDASVERVKTGYA
jgi:hypothetical protein